MQIIMPSTTAFTEKEHHCWQWNFFFFCAVWMREEFKTLDYQLEVEIAC